MNALESILSKAGLPERLRMIEELLLDTFGLGDKLAELSIPKVAVHNNPDDLGSYAVSSDPVYDDTYHLNSHAANDIRVLLHEAGHRIRSKLNFAAKQYLPEPADRVGTKLKEFYERINLEEMFAKFCEKIGLRQLGIQSYTHSSNYLSIMKQNIKNSKKGLYEWITHAFGYQKAEEIAANMNINTLKQLGRRMIYSNNPAEFGISIPYLIP